MTYKTAILDSGSTYIVVPQVEMYWIALQLNATRLATGHFIIDCDNRNTLPSISFYIENQPFVLSSSDYVLNVADQVAHGFNSSKCILGLISGKVNHEFCIRKIFNSIRKIDMQFYNMENPPSYWILGQIFMKKYYTTCMFKMLIIF